MGINGFGRIGKQIYRILVKNGIQIKLINDPNIDIKYLYYLAKYDTVYGTMNEIKLNDDSICTYGIETYLSNQTKPENIDWKKHGVDYVLECSGKFTTMGELEKHNARLVIVSCPCEDVPTYVYGVNHSDMKKGKVISAASCTTNCIAPLAKLLNDNFGIVEGTFTTVHAMTGSQAPVDLKGMNKRLARSCMNIIPSTTGASKSLDAILPSLYGKIKGMAFRVPVNDVSVLDFVVRLKKKASLSKIKDLIINSDSLILNRILGIAGDNVVSSDMIGNTRSTIVDFNSSLEISKNFFKIIAWYDNEYGYSCRMIDLLFYCTKEDKKLVPGTELDDLSNLYSTITNTD